MIRLLLPIMNAFISISFIDELTFLKIFDLCPVLLSTSRASARITIIPQLLSKGHGCLCRTSEDGEKGLCSSNEQSDQPFLKTYSGY